MIPLGDRFDDDDTLVVKLVSTTSSCTVRQTTRAGLKYYISLRQRMLRQVERTSPLLTLEVTSTMDHFN